LPITKPPLTFAALAAAAVAVAAAAFFDNIAFAAVIYFAFAAALAFYRNGIGAYYFLDDFTAAAAFELFKRHDYSPFTDFL
jgi:hypothetical protein